jgi:YbbR domain-containing protein
MALKEKRFPILLFSTVFAGVLWFSINMLTEYQTTVSLSLIPLNVKNSRSFITPLPERIQVKIQGTGWQLLRTLMSPGSRYELDFSEASLNQKFNLSTDFNERIKIPQGIKVIGVKPEAISVMMDETIKKYLPIDVNAEIACRPGYGIIGKIQTKPESVKVTGSRSLIASMSSWRTKLLNAVDLKTPLSTILELSDTLAYSLTVEPALVMVHIEVQPIAEKTFRGIPVEVNQVPENRTVLLIPPKCDIVVRGGVNEIASLASNVITAYIDYRSILLDTTGYLQPSIVLSRTMKVVTISPLRIQYVIRKKS